MVVLLGAVKAKGYRACIENIHTIDNVLIRGMARKTSAQKKGSTDPKMVKLVDAHSFIHAEILVSDDLAETLWIPTTNNRARYWAHKKKSSLRRAISYSDMSLNEAWALEDEADRKHTDVAEASFEIWFYLTRWERSVDYTFPAEIRCLSCCQARSPTFFSNK